MLFFTSDARFAVRSLYGKPGFTLVAIVSLGFAIAANMTLFSVVKAVLWEPLPFDDSDRIMALWDSNPERGFAKTRVAPGNYLRWKEQNDVFDSMTLYGSTTATLLTGGEPMQVSGTRVTQDFFGLLGLRAAVGRVLIPGDYATGAPSVAVFSHSLWTRRFGSDPGVVGQSIQLGNQMVIVVGVLPRQIVPVGAHNSGKLFFASHQEHYWTPFKQVPDRLGSHVSGVLARLKAGVELSQARSQMQTIAGRLEKAFPRSNTGYSVRVVPLEEEVVGQARVSLLVLLGAVGLVLLVTVANVSNLVLIRAQARRKELAIRSALGASSLRLFRQTFVESWLLTGTSGLIGILAAVWAIQMLPALNPGEILRLSNSRIDGAAAVMVLTMTLLVAVLFALISSLGVHQRDLTPSLAGGRGSQTSSTRPHLRRFLIALEMTTAVVLVIGSSLLLRSFYELNRVDPGFQHVNVLTLDFLHTSVRYREMSELTGFYDRLLSEIRSLPGVTAAGAAYDHPLISNWEQSFRITAAPPPAVGETPVALFRTVTPDLFDTLGIELLQGRSFSNSDTADSPGVAIVNAALVRRYLPGSNPLGKNLDISTTHWVWGDAIPTRFGIVGVVEDVSSYGLQNAPAPAFYLPYKQTPHHNMTVFARTAGDPRDLLSAIRSRLREIDPMLPIVSSSTVAEILDREVAQPRLSMMVLGAFALCSLFLAVVGLWGVLSFIVRQRTHEIGVRLALGAQRKQIFGCMLLQGILPALVGWVTGLVGALAISRYVRSLLFQVSPTDTSTYAVASVVLLLVALTACSLPAWKAAGTDPAKVLKYDPN